MNIPITETGKRIQNYVFNYSDFLGAGNFSKCYKGYNQITNEVVAIKIVELNSLKSKKLEELLFQEIEILKKLNHPSVLKCFQIFTSNRNCYIITELCNQGNLQNRLKLKKLLDQTQANPIIKDVYDGLVYLSQQNIVHRDLKSANIFLQNGRAKIADFGFAKEIKHNFKDLNIGSPLYMAPQGILHNIYGPKTEVWAIGILVFELFHGSSPYINCKTEEELKRNVMIPINWKQLRKDLPQDIKQFILTCLQINEQNRATIQQLGNLGYMRRLSQGLVNNCQTAQYDIRSPSKSVNLSANKELQNNYETEKQRVNNNFRVQNNGFVRNSSRSKTMNERQQVIFRSVDMRATNHNNNSCRNQGQYHSPHKRQEFSSKNNNHNHNNSSGMMKFDMNSPGHKRQQMISSLRPMSSSNQPIYMNGMNGKNRMNGMSNQKNPIPCQQNPIPYQQYPIPYNQANPNYQYLVFPPQNVFTIQPQQQLTKQQILTDNIYNNKPEVQNRPLSSYNQQQQQHSIQPNFDSISYNSMNGFIGFNPKIEPNQNINFTHESPFLSHHQPSSTTNLQQPFTSQEKSFIFPNHLNFKQAIFFIHHCRLLFKFLFLYKDLSSFDQILYLKIFKYLMSVLTELNTLAENNGLVTDGEKAGLKIKKFKEVNLQYLAKYKKQLEDNNYNIVTEIINQNSFNQINSALRQVFNKINEDISITMRKNYLNSSEQNTIVVGHLCIIIIASLKEIEQGIYNRNFKKLLHFKHIETILNTPKEEFTLTSFRNYRDKFIA